LAPENKALSSNSALEKVALPLNFTLVKETGPRNLALEKLAP